MSDHCEPWIRLIRVGDCPRGTGRFVARGDHELAVFHLIEPDRFVVAKNACPHAGGNLAAGEIAGSVVTCPWHHWQFDMEAGRCVDERSVAVKRYESRVEDGWVWAKLGGAAGSD